MDTNTVDPARLLHRAAVYAQRAGCGASEVAKLTETLSSAEATVLLGLTTDTLRGEIVNDLYKPRMHAVYAEHLPGVAADFMLTVRKSPVTLKAVRERHPELWAELQAGLDALSAADPVAPNTLAALDKYAGFVPSQAQVGRAGVAQTRWEYGDDGSPVLYASGPVEHASNVETSAMQLVQECLVKAQCRDAEHAHPGLTIDRTERVANAMGKLCRTVERLNAGEHGLVIALFAGRRASDRLFLLLQNLYCMRHLKGYAGTSAVLAAQEVDAALRQAGKDDAARAACIRRLLGTHAHEEVSIANQLLSQYDKREMPSGAPPAPVSAMMAHLLFFATNGVRDATALSDTFGTPAFLAAAAVTRLPDQFREDIKAKFGDDLKPETTLLGLIKTWRLDSGDYGALAEQIVAACEKAGLPKPNLMHSNLGDVDEVLEVGRLPERVKPSAVGFGTLADGFVPFEAPDGTEVNVKMSSIVMKAVQASVRGMEKPVQRCAGKLSDEADESKLQLDPRVPQHDRDEVVASWRALAAVRGGDLDGDAVSAALAAAYHDVTRKGILRGCTEDKI